ncbi:uncharacterized protein LOC106173921 [Lingula anatina]|uniref:Uncharacterized protein LOC106173921 n=1 Tax=Lingula anatina TaxID=7574 RepID=A0A1S3JK16_LINAN|nr:uncharacterized protein LOC106173921 [Lingula anatina]|eukprot:XP_013410713.1 uncharacterized protein LOC106173921 [Lingula anatina]
MPGNTSSSAHKKRIRIQDVSDSEDSVCRNSSDSDDEVVHSAKKKSRRLQLSDDDEEEKENRQSDEDGGEPEEDDSHRKSSRINLMEGRKRRQSLVFEKLKTPKRERLEAVGKDDSDHDEPDESDYNRIKTSEDDTDEDSQSGFIVSDTEEIEIEEEGEEEKEEISPTKKVSLKHSKKPVIDDDEDEEKDENGGAEVSDSDSIKMLSSSSDSESDASDEEDNVTDIHKTAEMPWKTTLTTYEAFMLVLEMLLNAVFDPEFLHPWNLENHNSVIRPAFQKISDEVHARKVIVDSQAWGRAYREALESHPRMKESDLSYSTTDCEACNRRDHPATRDILFTGNMYDEVTLQPLGEEEEQESDSGEEREEKEIIQPMGPSLRLEGIVPQGLLCTIVYITTNMT